MNPSLLLDKSTSPAILTRRRDMGITLRITLLAWFVALVTLLIFVLLTIPHQKATFLRNLESKANSVAVSLHDAVAGAAVNEDFASVVSASQTMLAGDPELDFLIVMKNDGFALITEQAGWKMEEKLNPYWQRDQRKPLGVIKTVPLLNRRVFHYAQPFDYSGIQWGWIHVGLSLKAYDQSVVSLYQTTLILAVGCIIFSFLASLFYARRLVRPLLRLRHVVQQIAGGDLFARADASRKDELGSLGDSVNIMTRSLARRDSILESVRFSAQQFLQASQWEDAINPVLSKIGQAGDVSRARLFENQQNEHGALLTYQRYEWAAPGITPQINNPQLQGFEYRERGFEHWSLLLGQGEILSGSVSNMSAEERALLEPQSIRSFIAIPVFVEGAWWGFLGLDDCAQERLWTEAERHSLRAAADMLGATIARQRVEKAMIIAKEGADQANRAKSEFLANMSHELRTPLNHIIGFTELVLSRDFGELNSEQAEYLKDVLGSSQHLLSLINDVLDLSKVEAGKMELFLSEVRIRELLENSLMMVKEKALKQAIRLAVDLDGVPEVVRADNRKLKQVVYNLLSNAVKFTPGGGEVRLGARIQETSEFKERLIDGHGSGKWLCVWVSDSGIGLKPEDLTRIFSPFEQVENGASRKYQGTGLGLTLTRKMVELHSGAIWAESAGVGKGSTFKFAIPLNATSDAGHGAA